MIVIVFDSVGYKTFMKANLPNMKSIGEVHLAYSYASWTLPSFASMFVGAFPACSIPNCKHHNIAEHNPFYLKNNNFIVFTDNPWIQVLAKSFKAVVVNTHNVADVTKYIYGNGFRYLGKAYNNAFIHVMETHFRGKKIWTEEVQIKELEKVDKIIKPILSLNNKIVITADHGENFGEGEKHGNFDGVFREYIYEVPIISSDV